MSARKLVMIPGPIEFSDSVLDAMSTKSQLHTSPEFVKVFQETLKMTRELFQSSEASGSQLIVLSGSGTLGWDLVGSNLLQSRSDALLVLSTGFFSDSFLECLRCYSDNVDVLSAPLGEEVALDQVSKLISEKKYKMVTITQVDTSTAVLSNVELVAKLVKKENPETLVIVDGVCSVAVEQLKFDDWGLDFVLTASQKLIGVPSGLSISVLSKLALSIVENSTQNLNFYANLHKWLPIMKAYEAGNGAYFATPSIQLIHALNTSLKEILSQPLSSRFEKNHALSVKFKENLESLGLKSVSKNPDTSANGLSAFYFPENVNGAEFLSKIASKGFQLAGGIHADIKTKYFRVGHMGVSALRAHSDGKTDLDLTFDAIAETLKELTN